MQEIIEFMQTFFDDAQINKHESQYKRAEEEQKTDDEPKKHKPMTLEENNVGRKKIFDNHKNWT